VEGGKRIKRHHKIPRSPGKEKQLQLKLNLPETDGGIRRDRPAKILWGKEGKNQHRRESASIGVEEKNGDTVTKNVRYFAMRRLGDPRNSIKKKKNGKGAGVKRGNQREARSVQKGR